MGAHTPLQLECAEASSRQCGAQFELNATHSPGCGKKDGVRQGEGLTGSSGWVRWSGGGGGLEGS